MASSTTQGNPFIKQLASSDKKLRDKAVESLQLYISNRKQFEELELLKLWKGLFYCVWMSDRPRAQQQLARDLADLMEILPPETIVPFLSAFWKTIAREWNGIDVLRMDKFMFLVRQYLATTFQQLSKQNWLNSGMIESCMTMLEEIPLNAKDHRLPNGLRYHVLDIYVDELDKVDAERDSDIPLELLLKPLRNLEKSSPTKSVRLKAKEALDDARLADWKGEQGTNEAVVEGKRQSEDSEEEEWGGIEN
ncbi:hypothetical protein M501DRAFT_421917 [Patellaria atrata CBS 101060]|uniref:Nucleolar protein NOP52 variant n=1 Tax=Patellaria atrata CBS 101060 TaxID=1346257 RepID=A0A9P4SJ33_9PEZI|nr:hypothetical protein M501DRAFT_421917 [Patellaria atrata CBS 101060]